MQGSDDVLVDHLRFLYGEERADACLAELQVRLGAFREQHPALGAGSASGLRLSERDVILITYGDQVREPDKPPLQSLAEVLETHLDGVVTGVHILPFFPYSSDDGFSVIDYTRVNPDWGTWGDIRRLRGTFRLMFDAVINHISVQSAWFRAFLRGDPAFAGAFIVVEPGTDLSMVTRPRALPLLTPVQTAQGEKLVWTTFSTDQVDLNFADPGVLLRIIDVLLFYVEQGAEIIRLDAIAYLWKRAGTSCIHLEETHRVVRLFRAVLDRVAPDVMLITETNVPHAENVSYFGDGSNEAQMVYQFSLPPLVLHAIARGEASYLTRWATGLSLPSALTTFYNFTASHDGVGVRPLEGILPPEEIAWLAERTAAHGGHVSYKTNPDGTKSPYELNISYFDALSDPQAEEALDVQVRRFIVSQAIMLALQGVPAVYVHSLFGSRSDHDGVARTGRYRSINREKFERAALEAALADPESLRAHVFEAYRALLAARMAHPAFHPNSPQRVLNLHPALFTLLRGDTGSPGALLCIHNVAGRSVALSIDLDTIPFPLSGGLRDVCTGVAYFANTTCIHLDLAPYQILWLQGGEPS